MDLRRKVETEQIPMYVVTHRPVMPYQHDAMDVMRGSHWIELRYNESVHAKVYVAMAVRDAESFALFGSGNLTAKSIESNIEIGMMVYSEDLGRDILRELNYWSSVHVRTLKGSKLIQPIQARRR
jgi:phosphatidylserine/phosphatidylglycerophosphate/cardiolipin synthase-like enzyme